MRKLVYGTPAAATLLGRRVSARVRDVSARVPAAPFDEALDSEDRQLRSP